ncbi:NYN domain-containing protein [Agrococcus sp. Marseille-Q4369]|nr:NYN domain-containing protein [Agrococcus sp. Marseille-Q4369]
MRRCRRCAELASQRQGPPVHRAALRHLRSAQRTSSSFPPGASGEPVSHELPASFVQALIAMGYRPVPLSGEGKIVDIAIQRTAEALVDRDADVMLVSHDRDFAPQMERLADDEERRVGVILLEFL